MPTALDRLIVIGASSGGIDALSRIVSGLPADFAAPICVVVHTSSSSPAVLGSILDKAGPLPAATARDGEPLRPGHIHVAPPDHHLIVEPGILCLSRGPRENRCRPAVDPLFRSAAQVYGPRVMGVVLTGNLDDGAAGLWAVRRLGGVAVVQDPADATYPSMPEHAIRLVPDAHRVPVDRIAAFLTGVMQTSVHEHAGEEPAHLGVEVRISKAEEPLRAGLLDMTTPSTFTCPECHGVLLALSEGGRTRFRCHTGHAYGPESLAAAASEAIDDALGGAQRALHECLMLMRNLADDLDPDVDAGRIERLRAQESQARHHADVLHRLLAERAALTSTTGD